MPVIGGLISRCAVGAVGVGVGAYLGHDHDVVLAPNRVSDDAVDEAVAIELGGVDVIDAELDGAAEHPDRAVTVVVEPVQLHRAVADSRHCASCEGGGPTRMGLLADRGGRAGHGSSSLWLL